MTRRAVAHLKRADPVLHRVITHVGPCRFVTRAEGTHFDALVRSIVYQQLAGKAAATIHGRLLDLWRGKSPTPAQLLRVSDERLRAAGISRQKIGYLRDLAAHVHGGRLPLDDVDERSDDEILQDLVRVKGIGRWTAQMFLMFRLGRLDVLPELDLGVQKGIQLAYGLRALPAPKQVQRIGAGWAPYRSVASWYMWRVVDVGGIP
ncbi:MAG TPA: hypothetical protein VFY16_08985 [Gemmatimonadaceae bacterium]|nr:hypothetical protein [Gemmatimonadaceae bacterium]